MQRKYTKPQVLVHNHSHVFDNPQFFKAYKESIFRLKGVGATRVICNSALVGTYTLSFYRVGSSGSTIEAVFKAGLQQGDFGNSVTANNTKYTFEFQGTSFHGSITRCLSHGSSNTKSRLTYKLARRNILKPKAHCLQFMFLLGSMVQQKIFF